MIRNGGRGDRLAWILCTAAAVACQRAWALDVGYGIGYDRQYSNNVLLQPTDPRRESINVGRLMFMLRDQTSDKDVRLDARYDYYDYVHHVLADRPYASVNGTATWTIVPETFSWNVADLFGQSVVDPLVPANQNNLQNLNIFSTGPSFAARTGVRSGLLVDVRYQNSYYQRLPADNNRALASTRWFYEYSPLMDVGLGGDTTYVRYRDTTLYTNYRRDNAYVRTQYHPHLSVYTLDVGGTAVYPTPGSAKRGLLFGVSWARQSTEHSGFRLAYRQQYSDATQDAVTAALTGGGAPELTQPVGIGDFYYSRNASLSYHSRLIRLTNRFEAYYRNLDYNTLPLDQRVQGVNFDFSYAGLILTTPSIFGGYEKTRFTQVPQTNELSWLGLRVTYVLRRNLDWRFEVQRTHMASSNAAVRYDETRALVGIVYQQLPPVRPRTTAPQQRFSFNAEPQ